MPFEECLFVFPADEWEKIEEKLRSLTFTQSHHRLFIRILLSHASDAVLDRQGRITIPQNLLSLAKINKEVLIIGALQRIEIWDPEIYAERKERGTAMLHSERGIDVFGGP